LSRVSLSDSCASLVALASLLSSPMRSPIPFVHLEVMQEAPGLVQLSSTDQDLVLARGTAVGVVGITPADHADRRALLDTGGPGQQVPGLLERLSCGTDVEGAHQHGGPLPVEPNEGL